MAGMSEKCSLEDCGNVQSIASNSKYYPYCCQEHHHIVTSGNRYYAPPQGKVWEKGISNEYVNDYAPLGISSKDLVYAVHCTMLIG